MSPLLRAYGDGAANAEDEVREGAWEEGLGMDGWGGGEVET